MGWWKWVIVPFFKYVGKALSKTFDKVAGQAFTLGCLIISGESLRQIKNNHAAMKVTQHLGKNTCNMAFGTASGGTVYHGYSYEAKGDGLECNHLPERKVIEEEVKTCVRRFNRQISDKTHTKTTKN